MINLLEVLPNANNATSFYRGRLCFLRLQQEFPDKLMIYPYFNGSVSWENILLYDMVFLQRPYTTHHYNVFSAAKRYGLPVWIDYDDLLCDIPPDNPAHDGYGLHEKKLMGEFIKHADIITVSTNALKHYLSKKYGHGKKIRVIHNALDRKIFKKTPQFRSSKNILWRGTHTHMNDLMEYSAPIIDCMTKNSKWNIDFMGYNPFFITNQINNCTYTKKMEMDNYIRLLDRLNYSICIVPLHACPFNYSKSNIAWIEATYAGAVCLAPDWEEWQKPGIINYSDPEDFKKKMNAMITGKFPLKELHRKSWQYISENLTLDKVNKQRSSLIMH